MAARIGGPLHYERMGRSGPVMIFIHPNPMDQSCWMFQMAHLSTWYRCIAVDLPGYGRSPKALPGLTTADLAAGCWEAIDAVAPGETTIVVGCSVGSVVAPYMYHQRPSQTAAMVLSGTGYNPLKEVLERRSSGYVNEGLDYRWRYTLDDFSPAFRATPLARWFADMFVERNEFADVDSILHQFEALRDEDPEGHHADIDCPTILLSGTEDGAHPYAFALKDRIPSCELRVLPGAGHACQIEQPWLFDDLMIDFLTRHGLFPESPI